jgi:hypothetical protein
MVPAQAKAIGIQQACGHFLGLIALDNQRMFGLIQQLIEWDGRAEVGKKTAHGGRVKRNGEPVRGVKGGIRAITITKL